MESRVDGAASFRSISPSMSCTVRAQPSVLGGILKTRAVLAVAHSSHGTTAR